MQYRPFIPLAFYTAAFMASLAAQTSAVIAKPAPPAARATGKAGWVMPRTADGKPDLQGVWNSVTATPVERPVSLKDKAFFTPAEALAFEKETEERESKPAGPGVGTYNNEFFEFGTKVSKTLRTSLIYEPADGKLPPLTPAAAAEVKRRQELIRAAADPETMRLGDQCLMFSTGSPPMIPYHYNSNYRIAQTKDHVAIYVEMIHDTRVIPVDNRPHLPANVQLWYGDSVGHWEGDTLVVDTTNFMDKTSFYGSDRNMHVVEKFSLFDKDTILYRFEVEDPTAFTKPVKGEYTFGRGTGPIYEYACHEGNYALPGVLRGARAEEAAAAKAAKKQTSN